MDNSEAKTFSQVATTAARSLEQSTTRSNGSSDLEYKQHFLKTFRIWSVLFKRKDSGDEQTEKWLIAEYYDALKHLSTDGLDTLTKSLRETCTFFPSIKECLDATRAGQYDWGHPFRSKPHLLRATAPARQLAAPMRMIGYDDADS